MRQILTIPCLTLTCCAIFVAPICTADEAFNISPHPPTTKLNGSDLTAVYELFGVSPDDPGILKVGGTIVDVNGGRTRIDAYLAKPIAVSDTYFCVMDIDLRSGQKDGSSIDWQPVFPEPIRLAWQFHSPGSCNRNESDMTGTGLLVGRNVPIDILLRIMKAEAAVFGTVFEFPEGAPFHHWDDFRMVHLSMAVGSADDPKYYARFVKDGEKGGPNIYFSFDENGIKAEAVYNSAQKIIR